MFKIVFAASTGDRYVEITREDFEKWLDASKSALSAKKWEKLPHRVGGYLIHLNDLVGIHVATSLHSGDRVMDVGDGSMKLRLVSLVHGRVLNKKATGKQYFQRTKNWQKTLLKGCQDLKRAYDQSKDFYDQIAVIEDQKAYIADKMKRIEAHEWLLNKNEFVRSLYTRLQGGGILTKNQEEALDRLLASLEHVQRGLDPKVLGMVKSLKDYDLESQVNILRSLYLLARSELPSQKDVLVHIQDAARLLQSGREDYHMISQFLQDLHRMIPKELETWAKSF
jgi:hypothetical protein